MSTTHKGTPRTVTLTLDYLPIDNLLECIEDPAARGSCKRILADNRPLFEQIPGSTHNHQIWPGGYVDHVTDCMNYARHQYALLEAIGRPLQFSCSDALLVIFLHDLEKPWRIQVDAEGNATNREGLETKEQFKAFREKKLVEYGIALTADQHNALTYVEGELKNYSSAHRVMNELAAFCHAVDTWSARGGHAYPKPSGEDEWSGAGRFRGPNQG